MPRKEKTFFIFLFLFFLCRVIVSGAEVVDKILVIVNDEVITQGEVNRIIMPIYAQYKNLYSGEAFVEKFGEARRDVLERLVHDKLLLSAAKRRKIEIEDKEVESKIEELRKRFVNEKEFEEVLARENMSLSVLERKHRERLMIERLIDVEIKKRVSISPSDVLNYYTDHRGEFREPRKVKIKSILIRAKEERPEDEALKLSKRILKRLREGCDFGSMAKEYSDGPYASSAGDMGWVKEGELMGRINEFIFRLEEKETSCILKTKVGFHIFMIEEKMDAKTTEFPEAKDRVERILFGKRLEKKLRTWIEELKKDAYIAFR